jgi:hypothetical protein
VAPDGSRKCSLEFDLAAYDVYGKRVSGLSQTARSPLLTAEQGRQFLKQKQFQYIQQLDLPPGESFYAWESTTPSPRSWARWRFH